MAKRYGTYGGVVLQEQPCGATLSHREAVFCVFTRKAVSSSRGFASEWGTETVTFGAWRQDRPLDGVGLEASLKAVIPQGDYSVLPSGHKPLQAQVRHTSKKGTGHNSVGLGR